jgi:hypothetical protein
MGEVSTSGQADERDKRDKRMVCQPFVSAPTHSPPTQDGLLACGAPN